MAACLSAVNVWPLISKQREAEVIPKNTLTGQCSFSLIADVPWQRCDRCMWTQPYRDQSERYFFQDTSFTEIYVKLTIGWKSEGRIGQLYVCVRSVYLLFNQKWIRGILYRQLAVHVTCHILNHILPIEAFLHLIFSTEIPSYRNTAVYRTLWDNISNVPHITGTDPEYTQVHKPLLHQI